MTPSAGWSGRSSGWSRDDIGDQTGRTFVVTGSTSGLGREVALELARNGARVVLAARNPDKLDDTEAALRRAVPDADLDRLLVDLADLGSVRRAADDADRLGPVDVLVSNAGVMATPYRRTVDGLELQMATNHFGPFLLAGLLLPRLVASGGGRVVTVSSNGHRLARSAPLGDPQAAPGRYQRWPVYCQTKLANLLFTYELDRRLREAGLRVTAVAAHPGYSATHLLSWGQTLRSSGGLTSILDAAMRATAQSAEAGAQPILMAATAALPGGSYVGPRGPGEWRGAPHVVTSTRLSRDRDAQRSLWELSEKTVDLTWP
ncbi:SDR family NAD(P)-dependent oxidoreductase [Nocardioides guangzhouensis]|uniref:SDR family NAD(P)-dependent oxidoreductase n=1 Tax=Nocardioides guangzhouensis TaxID=2497878 RepID=A0A4Q4ZCM3_9ACTN|nr:oxidoreductase [Nocardioides guangzhouensis]RYP85345.1 SDR family NAD(P)-dependent oxidoreductase [Nocardioides guangzhouensis]